MELFVFRHSEYKSLYNCSFFQELIERKIPHEQRVFVPESIVSIVLATVYYILYVPCLGSIYYRQMSSSCHKMLFFIGIADMGILWILGFYVGYMSLVGNVFCSQPTIGFWIGLITTSIWMSESSADFFLAINRCVKILSENLYQRKRAWIWCAISTLYFLFWFIFMKPATYSSIYFGGWFFSPYAGFLDYESKIYVVHNYTIAIGLPGIYSLSACIFVVKYKTGGFVRFTQAELMMFVQVLLISILNAFPAIMYVHMQHAKETNKILVAISQFGWLHIHGFPPVIYLLLNKTIRQDCAVIWTNFNQRFKINRRRQISGANTGWIT